MPSPAHRSQQPRIELALTLLASGVASLAAVGFLATHQTVTVKDNAVEVAQQAQLGSRSTLYYCGLGDHFAKELDEHGLCAVAESTVRTPVAAGLDNDDAHIIALIRAEFARRPAVPATASPEQINSAVSQVILRNPELFRSREVPIGAPPAQPDQRQINAAVSTYLAAHPDQFRGRDGSSGRPGEAVTRTVQAPPFTTTVQQPPATVTQTMQPDPVTENPPATDPPAVEPTPGAGATPTDTPSPSRNFAPQMRTRSPHQEPLLRLRPPL